MFTVTVNVFGLRFFPFEVQSVKFSICNTSDKGIN